MTRDFRPRYILFEISADKQLLPLTRKQMIIALRSQCIHLFDASLKEKNIYLTRFNGKKGIVRCEHTEKEETIQLLHSISHIDKKSVTINTIATSGTIKSLIQKHDTNKELKR